MGDVLGSLIAMKPTPELLMTAVARQRELIEGLRKPDGVLRLDRATNLVHRLCY